MAIEEARLLKKLSKSRLARMTIAELYLTTKVRINSFVQILLEKEGVKEKLNRLLGRIDPVRNDPRCLAGVKVRVNLNRKTRLERSDWSAIGKQHRMVHHVPTKIKKGRRHFFAVRRVQPTGTFLLQTLHEVSHETFMKLI